MRKSKVGITRNNKFNRSLEKSIIRHLDMYAKKYGLREIRHSTNKWITIQRDKASLAKELKSLEERKAELNRKLSR